MVRLDRTPRPPAAPATPPTDPDGWLSALTRLLRLPAAEREAIHDELSGHLQERVHDLMIGGATEEEAIRAALTELGGAAELARRFRHAHRHTFRRIAMNLTCLGLGITALGLGVVAVKNGAPHAEHVRISLFEQAVLAQEVPRLDAVISVEFVEAPLHDVFEYLTAAGGMAIHARWNELADHGIDRHDTQIELRFEELPMRRLLDMVCAAMSADIGEKDTFGWRADGHVIEIGPTDVFERRERTLVSYDVTNVVMMLEDSFALGYDDATAQVTDVIHQLVSPDDWMANGGALGQIHVVGGKMFVLAPPRMHQPVAWILDELAEGAAPGPRAGGMGGGMGGPGGGGGGAGGGAGHPSCGPASMGGGGAPGAGGLPGPRGN